MLMTSVSKRTLVPLTYVGWIEVMHSETRISKFPSELKLTYWELLNARADGKGIQNKIIETGVV